MLLSVLLLQYTFHSCVILRKQNTKTGKDEARNVHEYYAFERDREAAARLIFALLLVIVGLREDLEEPARAAMEGGREKSIAFSNEELDFVREARDGLGVIAGVGINPSSTIFRFAILTF